LDDDPFRGSQRSDPRGAFVSVPGLRARWPTVAAISPMVGGSRVIPFDEPAVSKGRLRAAERLDTTLGVHNFIGVGVVCRDPLALRSRLESLGGMVRNQRLCVAIQCITHSGSASLRKRGSASRSRRPTQGLNRYAGSPLDSIMGASGSAVPCAAPLLSRNSLS